MYATESIEEQIQMTLTRAWTKRTFTGFREVVCLKLVLKMSGICIEKKDRVFQVEAVKHKNIIGATERVWLVRKFSGI